MSANLDVAEAPVATTFQRSVDLSSGFLRAILADPSILDDIPNGVTLALLPDNDDELRRMKIETGLKAVREGRDVYFRHVRVADFPPEPELPDGYRNAWLEHPAFDLAPDERTETSPSS